jgi:UDP:flavonoid glycosyltransferase YjiC (YdhE family)
MHIAPVAASARSRRPLNAAQLEELGVGHQLTADSPSSGDIR